MNEVIPFSQTYAYEMRMSQSKENPTYCNTPNKSCVRTSPARVTFAEIIRYKKVVVIHGGIYYCLHFCECRQNEHFHSFLLSGGGHSCGTKERPPETRIISTDSLYLWPCITFASCLVSFSEQQCGEIITPRGSMTTEEQEECSETKININRRPS